MPGLSPRERAQWREDGYFIRDQVFSDAEVGEFQHAAEAVCRAAKNRASDVTRAGPGYSLDGNRFVDMDYTTLQYEHRAGTDQVRVIEPVHDLDPRFAQLVADERLAAPMRELVGTSAIGLWTAKLNMKPPHEGSGFRWHQDSPYWIHDHADVDRLPNVFVAFDAATSINGALRLVRGSHTRGGLPGLADGSQLEGFFTHPDEIDESQIRVPELRAGSALFFSPHLIHGSGPNHSAQPRRAIIVTYQEAGLPELKSGRIPPAL